MSETLYEVTDGKVAIPADLLLGGENYTLRENGKGEYYLAHVPRRDDDGSRSVLILEDGYTALQRFCHEMAQGVMTHRPEYTLALSGLMVWALQEERQPDARNRVQAYGQALYGGEKHGRTEDARSIRLLRDAMTAINQFASSLSEVLGGMNAERSIVLTALTTWAVEQEEAPDVVDDYVVQMYTMRREERKRARAQTKGEDVEEDGSEVIVTDDRLVEEGQEGQ
ncbi:MAG: hypothetical protein OEU26_00610 [Candidatus Tectomicrobia bacterium]|nr:hypothetical protein [Candidatus Tectomicrobia bacterium]